MFSQQINKCAEPTMLKSYSYKECGYANADMQPVGANEIGMCHK